MTVALLTNPDLSAWTSKGEVLGTPLAAPSWLLRCELGHPARPARRSWLAVCAMTACGFKQSLVGGGGFAVVLLACLPGVRPAAAGPGGPGPADGSPWAPRCLVLACIAWLALSPATIAAGWYQVVGFRADASAVLAASDSRAPVERGHDLIWLFVFCGMAPLAVLGVASVRRWFARWPALSLALLATTVVDLVGVVVSGSYWHAYLVPLIPDVALLAALAASCAPPFRSLTRFVATLAVIATSDGVRRARRAIDSSPPRRPDHGRPGHAISLVAGRDDTIVSLYGNAELVAASGLPSPYRHLWSLPMRTLDPRSGRAAARSPGRRAPTWIVGVLPLNSSPHRRQLAAAQA